MWIATTTGFYSMVQSPDDPVVLIVRARVREDLERLKKHLPEMSAIRSTPNRDYQFRALAKKSDVAVAIGKAVLEIGYPNYKAAAGARLGMARARLLGEVWRVLLGLAGLREPAGLNPADEQ